MIQTQVKHSFLTMLKELTEAGGPSGCETAVREVMERWVRPYADEIRTDRLGGLIARRGTHGPRIMIAGHLDEIGFMVTRITDQGYLHFQTLGGWWSQVLPAQRVEVLTKKGKVLGVIGSKPPHMMEPEEQKKAVSIDDLYIDIGVESRQEAEELGIRPGDFVIPKSEFTVMANENRLVAKAFDNRLGCAVAVEVLYQLAQGVSHDNQVFAVGTVMEEVGCRGAYTATEVVKPDIAIAVDVGIATDTPGVNSKHSSCELGKGPILVLYDARHIPHQGLLELVKQVAEEEQIPYQTEVVQRGATDAANIHTYKDGVPAISLGVPARYIHSHTSIIDRRDAEMLVRWLVAIVKRLDAKTVEKLIQE
jgi:endoglucanase